MFITFKKSLYICHTNKDKKVMKTTLISLMMLITTFSLAGGIKTKTYNPGSKAIFDIASTIIYGDKDAYLVDAQFQKQYAEELVKEIKALKRNLKLVYISQSDPDYYFALDVIKKNFPNAKIVSTAQTAYLISASKDEKLTVWGPKLKADAPSEIIIPEAITSLPDLEGNKIEIRQRADDPAHSFLWIPSIKTVLGGISVAEGAHIWMADTQSSVAIDRWIQQIDDMKALNPSVVIPSHFLKEDFSPKVLDFVKGYLTTFKNAAAKSSNSEGIINTMTTTYPNLPGVENLELGAKVFKGEMQWDLKSPYPAIGHHLLVNFGGDYIYDLNFIDNKQMRYTGTTGTQKGLTELVNYTAVEVAPKTFMVYWREPKTTKANVVHIQDYNKNIVYTNIAEPDGSFIHLKGSFELK